MQCPRTLTAHAARCRRKQHETLTRCLREPVLVVQRPYWNCPEAYETYLGVRGISTSKTMFVRAAATRDMNHGSKFDIVDTFQYKGETWRSFRALNGVRCDPVHVSKEP